MESRGDNENGDRTLYNMNPRQLVDVLAYWVYHHQKACSPTRGRDEADRECGLSLPGQGIHILSFISAVMPMSAAVTFTYSGRHLHARRDSNHTDNFVG